MTKRTPHHLTLYRRHAGKCPMKGQPLTVANVDDCQCPFWVHGKRHGVFVQEALHTREYIAAKLKRDQMLHGPRPTTTPPGITSIEPRADVTVKEAAANFLAVKEKKIAPSSLTLYTQAVSHFGAYVEACSRPYLRQIDTDFARQYLNSCDSEWAASTSQQRLRILRGFFNYCKKASNRWVTESPFEDRDLSYAVPEGTRTPFDLEQVAAILDAVERMPEPKRDRARAIILLLLRTGMRICDAAFFERDYVTRDGQADYYVIKNKRKIDTPPELAQDALDALAKLPPSRVYYFQPDVEGDYQEARQALRSRRHFSKFIPDYVKRVNKLTYLVQGVLHRAGIPYGKGDGCCHRFRHTFAVNMLLADVPIWVVSRMLGHKDVKTTEKHYMNLVSSYRYKMSHYTRKLNYAIPA